MFGGVVLRMNFVGFWKDCDYCCSVMQRGTAEGGLKRDPVL